MGVVRGVWARIGSLLNTLQTPRKCEPGLCSGEETRARGGVGGGGVVWAVGVVRARGGVGTHWQPLNTLETPTKCKPGVSSGEAGVEWGVGGGGGEGAGGCGHAWAAYSLNT